MLGGAVVLAENPRIVKLANGWLIMNPGGGPPVKPDVTLRPPDDPGTASSFLDIRVADIERCHRERTDPAAEFLTPPLDRKDPAPRPQGRTALLPARPRRLPDRGRPVHRPAERHPRRPARRAGLTRAGAAAKAAAAGGR